MNEKMDFAVLMLFNYVNLLRTVYPELRGSLKVTMESYKGSAVRHSYEATLQFSSNETYTAIANEPDKAATLVINEAAGKVPVQ